MECGQQIKLDEFTLLFGPGEAHATHTVASFLLFTKHVVQSHELDDFLNSSFSGTVHNDIQTSHNWHSSGIKLYRSDHVIFSPHQTLERMKQRNLEPKFHL